MEKYWILSGLWVAYFILHSGLATNKIKEKIRRFSQKLFSWYRLIYTLIALITLVPVAWYHIQIQDTYLYEFPAMFKGLSVIIAMVGLILMIQSFKQYDMNEFLGFSVHHNKNQSSKEKHLNTTGLFSVVRHPIYFGLLIFLTGFLLYSFTIANLISYVLILIYLILGTLLEEKKLEKEFGWQYRKYQKEVPMLFPFLK